MLNARATSLAAVFIAVATTVFGQQPGATPTQVKIQSVTFEPGVIQGSNRQWIKIVTTFQSAPAWADGIMFTYAALIGSGNQFKVLPGTLRYANVKRGPNRAVMYVSPNTVERYGAPVAVHVRAFYKDDVADDFFLKPPANVSSSWETAYNKYPGLLLNVLQTPWVFSDYSASPDIFAAQ